MRSANRRRERVWYRCVRRDLIGRRGSVVIVIGVTHFA
jgi:hypothetical protein